ncbi:MAG: hypothetical protein K0Q99_38, partial [Clostridia bacterium]|nr:hypothetical protein [Clostridia bacterium]
DRIVISVKDNGIGIPIDMQQSVFDHFVQVDNSLKRRAEGSGIGLSIVKSLVELHGGSVMVNSDYKEGCEVIIEIPIVIIEHEDASDTMISISNAERVSIELSDLYI